jgi:hypothetical protein
MNWLSSPKVRLALIVNGLYFISLFTPAWPHRRPRLFAHSPEGQLVRPTSKQHPVYTPLAPPSGSSKAAALLVKEYDQLDVYLTDDLTLVRRPGYRLLLSPTYTTRASKPEPPETVLLRFVSFSDGQILTDDTPLMITADGVNVLDESARRWSSGNAARRSVAEGAGGQVVQGVGVDMSYEAFIETISARQVLIQLGTERVELTANQIEALRDMHRRLPQPLPPDDSHTH